MSSFPTFSAGPVPFLVAAITDTNGRSVLTFTWPAAANEGGKVLANYTATLWADAERTTTLPGGAPQNLTTTQATFTGVPKGAAYLLDVTAVATDASASLPISLLKVSPFVPGEMVGPLPGAGNVVLPDGQTVEGLTMPLRPVYGSVGGVKRWARIVTFGDGDGQVSALDVQYFLMAASDEIDAMLAARYAVPLTKYIGDDGGVRYPPPIPTQCDRLAASMLLASRRSVLTDTASTYADGLETSVTDKIGAMADSGFLVGQIMASGFLPKVYNPGPRQFTMRGDPNGDVFQPGVGYTDVALLQPHSLPYMGFSWRYGNGGCR